MSIYHTPQRVMSCLAIQLHRRVHGMLRIFTLSPTTMTIPAGQLTGTINVGITDDSAMESNESFTLTITSATNGRFAGTATSASAMGTIIDNDTASPRAVVSISNVEVDEGIDTGKMTFTVNLSTATSNPVNLTYTTTTAGTATAGSDYTSVSSQSFSISNTSRSQDITIDIIDDSINEFDETINVELRLASTTTHVDLAGGGSELTAIGIIRDDDQAPILQFASASVSGVEGAPANFLVKLVDLKTKQDTTSGKPISVNYAVVDGTTTSADYTLANPAMLTIPAR